MSASPGIREATALPAGGLGSSVESRFNLSAGLASNDAWFFKQLIPLFDLIKDDAVRCDTGDCDNIACSIWCSDLERRPWRCCFSCQKRDFGGNDEEGGGDDEEGGGFPSDLRLSDEILRVIAEKCVDKDSDLGVLKVPLVSAFAFPWESTVAERCAALSRKVKCAGRAHLKATAAYFLIPHSIKHGVSLSCSQTATCMTKGYGFRYCSVCMEPKSSMSFDKRHAHGLTSEVLPTDPVGWLEKCISQRVAVESARAEIAQLKKTTGKSSVSTAVTGAATEKDALLSYYTIQAVKSLGADDIFCAGVEYLSTLQAAWAKNQPMDLTGERKAFESDEVHNQRARVNELITSATGRGVKNLPSSVTKHRERYMALLRGSLGKVLKSTIRTLPANVEAKAKNAFKDYLTSEKSVFAVLEKQGERKKKIKENCAKRPAKKTRKASGPEARSDLESLTFEQRFERNDKFLKRMTVIAIKGGENRRLQGGEKRRPKVAML